MRRFPWFGGGKTLRKPGANGKRIGWKNVISLLKHHQGVLEIWSIKQTCATSPHCFQLPKSSEFFGWIVSINVNVKFDDHEALDAMDFAAQRQLLEQLRQSLVTAARPSVSEGQGLPGDGEGHWHMDAVLEQLDRQTHGEVQLVEAALARLSEGSYGFCHICGDAIDDQRLAENPVSPLCMSCSA